jgi:aspartate aminotransferase-like enzyme
MKLFTVGPVACYPEILDEMQRQMLSHRSEEYKSLHRKTTEMLQKFLETKDNVFLFPNTGTGVMEGSIRNCVEKKMLVCINGDFGKRYAAVGVSNGKIVEQLVAPLGKPITPSLLDEKLTQVPDVEAVAITYNETSIGLINPLPDLARVVKKYDKLLFVDAVSAMGGAEIKVDEWKIDVCFSSSQKCFGLPPGLAMGSVSEEAMKRSEKAVNKGWYFDFKLFQKYYQREYSTPMTPTIPQIYALERSLQMIDERGGKQVQFKLYRDRSHRIKEGIENLGFSLFPEQGYESPTVACVNAPANPSGPEVYSKMRERGFELAKGYGDIKNSTFRIGCMGYIPNEYLEEMLQALGSVVGEYRNHHSQKN